MRRGPRCFQLEQGLTLIEVLVALAIVAVALSAGLKAAGALTYNAQRMVEVTSAQWCAENQLTELKLAHQFPSVGQAEFDCEQLGRTYHGFMNTRPTPNPNFRRVDVRMTDDQGLAVLSIATVLPRP
jgi:general secretion pathway protein I